jgi:hypothetical protein
MTFNAETQRTRRKRREERGEEDRDSFVHGVAERAGGRGGKKSELRSDGQAEACPTKAGRAEPYATICASARESLREHLENYSE